MKILFIVPYPELEKTVKNTITKMHLDGNIIVTTVVSTVEQIKKISVEGIDAIIARGYTSIVMKQNFPHIINVELEISSYDIFRAVKTIHDLYAPQKVGFCGSYSFMENAEDLQAWLGCPLITYRESNSAKIKTVVEKACADGCDVILGGYSAKKCAQQLGRIGVVIESGAEAVEKVLKEAIRSINIKSEEQIKAEMYRMITKNAVEGILFVDMLGNVCVDNQAAQDMGRKGPLCHTPLRQIFPVLVAPLHQVLSGKKEFSIEIMKLNSDLTVSASLFPVKNNGTIYGAVINMEDITKIQELEGEIRTKLSEKGLQSRYSFENIIYKSQSMALAVKTAHQYAKADANIIIVGETGTGKEVFAQSIHHSSKRCHGPFVAVNCAALPENLLESELFGYVEGAFTGTRKGGKVGMVEQAHNGTLFLDEVSEIPLALQSKLLRVLQEKEVRRIGDDKVIRINVRIISATNKSLNKLSANGEFRKDLLYRLDVLRLFLPPLRRRDGDIEMLFKQLLNKIGHNAGYDALTVEPAALACLCEYPFEGNIRELQNVVERICVLCNSKSITKEAMLNILYPKDLLENDIDKKLLVQHKRENEVNESELVEAKEEAECTLLKSMQKKYNNNKGEMAKELQINRSTLWRKLKKYNL
jgi:transcriptional regulator with PAS, ATPase and Fis domain